MKRADVVIGEIYCETGALAYGREPAIRPKMVRFTSKQPAVRVFIGVVEEHPLVTPSRGLSGQVIATTRKTIKNTRSKIVPLADAKAYPYREEAARQPAGTTVFYVDQGFDRATLPCERRNPDKGKDWVPGLARPADVHRTWAEYQNAEQIQASRRQEQERPRRELQARLDTLGLKGVADALGTGPSGVSIRVAPGAVPAFLKWAERSARAPKAARQVGESEQ